MKSEAISVKKTIVFFRKRKKPHETFHILKMKTPFEKVPRFENENTF